VNDKKLNIFLADDDDDDRDFFHAAIKKLNADVELTMLNNGQKVIQHFAGLNGNLPDYVFLDINMPLVDGIECLRFIKNKYPDHRFPIIMLSTAFSNDMINRCYSAGASLYVRKPNKFCDLVDMLRFCIHQLNTIQPGNDILLRKY
jgi:CheY-like chemotaxis protein